ncbi:unnamed protein product [Sphagnum balticum]
MIEQSTTRFTRSLATVNGYTPVRHSVRFTFQPVPHLEPYHTPANRSYRQSTVVEKSCPPISFDLKSLHTPLLSTALNGGGDGVVGNGMEQRESRTERRSRLGSANWRRSVSGRGTQSTCVDRHA